MYESARARGSLYAALRFVALLPGLKLSGTILVLPVRVKTGGKIDSSTKLHWSGPVMSGL